MNIEVYKEMCNEIYEGESWDRMINCLERKDKEIERLKEMKLNTEKYASEMEDKYILEKNKNNKAIKYIYLHSTQRKWFVDISDRLHNQEIQFKGRIQDLIDILKGADDNENS